MIGYITLGTNNLESAEKFYDELLSEIGAKRIMEDEGQCVVWGVDMESPCLTIMKPFDGNKATVGNGVMIALDMENPEKVKSFHKKALSLGASCEGEPGPRSNGAFYCAYFRDLDGNKLNAFCIMG